jgi:hypothetical protein
MPPTATEWLPRRDPPLWADCVAKLFSRPKCATLIQELAQARNLDSRRHLIGFDCCAFAAQHRVLQQNRPIPDLRSLSESQSLTPPMRSSARSARRLTELPMSPPKVRAAIDVRGKK